MDRRSFIKRITTGTAAAVVVGAGTASAFVNKTSGKEAGKSFVGKCIGEHAWAKKIVEYIKDEYYTMMPKFQFVTLPMTYEFAPLPGALKGISSDHNKWTTHEENLVITCYDGATIDIIHKNGEHTKIYGMWKEYVDAKMKMMDRDLARRITRKFDPPVLIHMENLVNARDAHYTQGVIEK